jgi:hypothetical protein
VLGGSKGAPFGPFFLVCVVPLGGAVFGAVNADRLLCCLFILFYFILFYDILLLFLFLFFGRLIPRSEAMGGDRPVWFCGVCPTLSGVYTNFYFRSFYETCYVCYS